MQFGEESLQNGHFKNIIRFMLRYLDDQEKTIVQSPQIPIEVDHEVFLQSPTFKMRTYPVGLRIRTASGRSYLTFTEELGKEMGRYGIRKIYFALDLDSEQKILIHYQSMLFLVLGTAFVLCVVIGAQISESGFKPVQEMIEIAGKINSNTLHERIFQDRFPLELKALANTINAMLDRLEDSFERLARFSSDISHELRTPVNNLRGEIEVALNKSRSAEEYQEVLESSLEETLRISKIIDGLLFLARAENPETQIRKETVTLEEEIKKIVEFYEVTANEEGISIETVLTKNIEIKVERTLFQRAVGNVVANAINYTPPGGKIIISDSEAQNCASIWVRDNGEGIEEFHLPHIFDRFYRVDPSRTATKLGGYGLGLTIVKSILKLHGGKISISSQKNVGTEVQLTFPKITNS